MKQKASRPGDVGRREFIVGAGAFFTGTVTTLALSAPRVAGAASSCRVLTHDPVRCVGCGVCSLMCSLFREGESGPVLARSEITRDPFEYNFQFHACRQCRAPQCYFACPLQDEARCIDPETGLVFVNAEACIGCGRCVEACPYDPPGSTLHPVTGVSLNCDRCLHRAEGPVCVEYCTMSALSCSAVSPPRRSRGRIAFRLPKRTRRLAMV